jgi:heat shock protein HslJ
MKRMILLVSLITATAGCGGADVPSSSTDGTAGSPVPDPATTADGEWQLVSGAPLVEGFPVTLTIEGREAGGRAACNSFSAEVSVDAGTIGFAGVGQTEMACEPAVMDAESTFLSVLQVVESYQVTGGVLTLTGPGVELVLEPVTPVPTAELVGTSWVLETLVEGDAASSVMGEPSTLLLTADGSLEATTGCRAITGRWIEGDGVIVVTEMVAEGECPQELTPQDSHVVTVLEGDIGAAIDGDTLTLTSMGGDGLVYRAQG